MNLASVASESAEESSEDTPTVTNEGWVAAVDSAMKLGHKVDWHLAESSGDIMQWVARGLQRLCDLNMPEAHGDLLKAVFCTTCLSVVDGMDTRRIRGLGRARIILGIQVGKWYARMGEIPLQHRKFLYRALSRYAAHTSYFVGAASVARLKKAFEEMGHEFRFANTEEDARYGIDAWVHVGDGMFVPVQVKTGLREHGNAFEVITPETELDLENRMREAWPYLQSGGVPQQILLVHVYVFEGGGHDAAACAEVERTWELKTMIPHALREMGVGK